MRPLIKHGNTYNMVMTMQLDKQQNQRNKDNGINIIYIHET